MKYDASVSNDLAAIRKALLLRTVSILVMGQSNEQGPVNRSEFAAYPLAFQSEKRAGVICPMSPDVGVVGRGSWWPYVYDRLLENGWDAQIINCAVGSISVLSDLCGTVWTRVNSTAYYQKRFGYMPDRGYYGDVLSYGGKAFVVTSGRLKSAISAPPHANPLGTSGYQDFLAYSGAALSASSAPDVTSVAIGGTITDGDLIETCVTDRYAGEGTFYPGAIAPSFNGGYPNYNYGGALGERNAGYGFDPHGLLARAWEALARSHAERKIVVFAQGQSDLGLGAVTYGRAVSVVMNYFLARGCEVVIGNTCYSPGAANSTSTYYGNQVTGVQNAITELSAYYPGKVFAGANLYASMGMTGPMGGQQFTGTISGSTLTVSAVAAGRGSGIAVGQIVYNGSAAVGTVSALGTGAGGVGTYTLSGAVTTASTTLISAGAWLQSDGVHLNGAGCVGPVVGGVSCAGKYVSDSILAALG